MSVGQCIGFLGILIECDVDVEGTGTASEPFDAAVGVYASVIRPNCGSILSVGWRCVQRAQRMRTRSNSPLWDSIRIFGAEPTCVETSASGVEATASLCHLCIPSVRSHATHAYARNIRVTYWIMISSCDF